MSEMWFIGILITSAYLIWVGAVVGAMVKIWNTTPPFVAAYTSALAVAGILLIGQVVLKVGDGS